MSTAQVALLVSVLAVVLTLLNARWARRRDRREMFLRMHDRLLDPETVAGRRALYRLTNETRLQVLKQPENDEALTRVYRALALYDVLGLYVERGWIDRQTVLDEWAVSLSKSIEPGNLFIKRVRTTTDGNQRVVKRAETWPHWQQLAADAKAYLDRPHR